MFTNNRNTVVTFTIFFLTCFVEVDSVSAKTLPTTNSEILQIVNSSGVLRKGKQVSAAIRDNIVSISLYRKSTESMKSYKVDALLLAKEIFRSFSDVMTIRTYFYNSHYPDSYLLANINRSLINSFEKGSITDEDMLANVRLISGKHDTRSLNPNKSIRIKGFDSQSGPVRSLRKSASLDDYGVISGAKYKERNQIIKQLRLLKSYRVNVNSYFGKLLEADGLLRNGKIKEAEKAVDSLSYRVNQEVRRVVKVLEK